MGEVGQQVPKVAAIFGASGGIGAALCDILRERGCERVYAGSRSPDDSDNNKVQPFAFDLTDEQSIADAAGVMREHPPEMVIVATGILTLQGGHGPEKTYKTISAQKMEQVLRLNTVGPALIAKHLLPLLPRDRRAIFAAISARVGSIGDNGLGGWHSYRASKAALNMLIRNFAIEMRRSHKQAVICSLHPGTVDTELSQPFQGNVPDEKLFSPQQSAQYLLDVLAGLSPEDSGGVFAWDGKRIPE